MKVDLKVLALSLAALFMLSACGHDDETTQDENTTPAVEAKPVPAAVNVGHVVDARAPGTWGGWNLDGVHMEAAVAKLKAPANFSETGTVKSEIKITGVGATPDSINAASLAEFDIFFIGRLYDFDTHPITSNELNAIYNWVNAGGMLIATCDDDSHDAVCEFFSHAPVIVAGIGLSPTQPTLQSATHNLFNGSFGVVTFIETSGFVATFPVTTDADILAIDSSDPPNATILEKKVGLGTVILISDIDMITTVDLLSLTPGPDIIDDNDPRGNNDRFLGNLFEYAIQRSQ